MCPLPGPTHQSLSRNMPLPRARSDFSPCRGIKATLPLLMERKRGKHRLFFNNQSHRQYIPSHHTEGNGCSSCGSNLDDLTWPEAHIRVRFQIAQVTIIWDKNMKSIHFTFKVTLGFHLHHQNFSSAHPDGRSRSVNHRRMTHKSGLNLINSDAWLIAMLICRAGAKGVRGNVWEKTANLCCAPPQWTRCAILNSGKKNKNNEG